MTSELPDYARNANGDLRRQMRFFGPYGAFDSTRPMVVEIARAQAPRRSWQPQEQ